MKKSKNHQFEIISTNGSDLAQFQQSVCIRLSKFYSHVIVSTIAQTQHILIQISKNHDKILSSEIMERIVKMYPTTSGASLKSVEIRDNIARTAARVTKKTRLSPSIFNFTHVDLSMSWRVKTYAKLCFNRGLAEMTSTDVLVDKLSAAAQSDIFFVKLGVQKALGINMFKDYLKETANEYLLQSQRVHVVDSDAKMQEKDKLSNSQNLETGLLQHSDKTSEHQTTVISTQTCSASQECDEEIQSEFREELVSSINRKKRKLEELMSKN
jgi:hypothetical protein